MRWFAVFLILCVFQGWLVAGEKTKPVLMLNPGGHTKPITKIIFTPDGKKLVSVGWEAGIFIWDVASGELERVVRTAASPDVGGFPTVIYGISYSPDGQWLAAAVISEVASGVKSHVFLIALETGRVDRVLQVPAKGVIIGLAFSPKGKWLAACANSGVTLVWDTATLKEPLQLASGLGSFAFSPDEESLVTTAPTGGSIWSLPSGKIRETLTDANDLPKCIAWSFDGKTIATGHVSTMIRLWDRNGQLKEKIQNLGNHIQSVAFTADSRYLLFARSHSSVVGNIHDCVFWDLDKRKEKFRFDRGGQAFVSSVALSQDGKTAASSYDHEILLWSLTDGTLIRRLAGRNRGLYSAAWNHDGTAIASGAALQERTPNYPNPLEFSFHFPTLTLNRNLERDCQRAITRFGGEELTLEKGSLVHRKGAQIITMGPAPGLSAFTFLDFGKVATAWRAGNVSLVTKTEKPFSQMSWRSRSSTALAPSPNKRFLLSACADGTMHVLDSKGPVPQASREPLLSFMVAEEEWLAWTPEGYYAASPGGESLMGWSIDNGPDKLASFYPAAQFRKSLYRPDVIKLLLEAGSVEKALEMADKASGKKSQITDVAEVLPPFVVITSPDKAKIGVTEPTVEVRFVAKPVGKHPITAVRLMLNGRPYPAADGLKKFDVPRTGEVRDSWTVKLDSGKHTLAVQVESAVSKALSEPVEVTLSKARGAELEPDEKEKKLELPNLYVLAIGVSEYPQEALKLKYAAKDATVLAKTLQATSHSLYRNVEVKVLTDKDATRRNVLQGLTWLRKQMTQRDVAIVSFAGHGSQDADGKLYLLPVDVDKDDLVSTAVPGEQVKSILGGVPGRVIVLLDACHSGAVDGEKRRAAGSLTDDLVRDLVTDDYGVIVMCSSMGREFSLESATVEHGFFTLALVEGLSGKADYNKSGVVYLNGLDLYVTTRVKELSKGKQHPVTTRPTSIRSFPLSRPEKQSSSRAPELMAPRVLAIYQEGSLLYPYFWAAYTAAGDHRTQFEK